MYLLPFKLLALFSFARPLSRNAAALSQGKEAEAAIPAETHGLRNVLRTAVHQIRVTAVVYIRPAPSSSIQEVKVFT
jgi:hypothetical protein